MTADDVSKLASYLSQPPDIFQEVLAEQPLMKFLSNPLVAAVLGIAAAKWSP